MHETREGWVRDYVKRLRASVRFSESLANAAEWVCDNTRHPDDKSKAYSWKDHEVWIEPMQDITPIQVIRKPSQVGATEFQVRKALALAAILQPTRIIYTLPVAPLAKKLAKDRMDTVISNSPTLSRMINPLVDSTEQKQIGDSFLYIGGTFGNTDAISVPAKIVIKDELDFSNSVVIGKLTSRLRHNKSGQSIDISFSTPTVENHGVSAIFDRSDKKYYAVFHEECKEWVILDLTHNCVVIPGYNDDDTEAMRRSAHDSTSSEAYYPRTLLTLEKDDLDNADYEISKAWYRCPHCRGEVTHENLSNPFMRRWVATAVSAISGRQVFPHDVPEYNKIADVINQMAQYENRKDWFNFSLGLPFNDNATRFDVVNMQVAGPEIMPESSTLSATVAGLDVGKSSWFLVAIPPQVKGGMLEVVYAERIDNSKDGMYLTERTIALCKFFNVKRLVVDTAPDISAFRMIRAAGGYQQVYGCQYVRTVFKSAHNYSVDEEDMVLSANRTATLSGTCLTFNSQKFVFRNLAQLPVVREHLRVLEKVVEYTENGEETHRWSNNRQPDHYGQALNYLNMAADLYTDDFLTAPKSYKQLVVTKVKMFTKSSPSSLLTGPHIGHRGIVPYGR